MDPFETKSIFIWNVPSIEGGNAERIAQVLKTAGFGSVMVKAAGGNAIFRPNLFGFPLWMLRENVSPEFVKTLHMYGIAVIGWGFNFGVDPDGEGRIAAQQVDRLDLDGWIFDVEGAFDERASAGGDAGKVIGTYLKTVKKKVKIAFCSWAMFNNPVTGSQWHPKAAANLFMSFCDYGMPMMYWQDVKINGKWNPAKDAADYFAHSFPQWQKFGKPIIPAGRAYNGDKGTMSVDGIVNFVVSAINKVPGLTWWGMDWAYKNPEIWAALSALVIGDNSSPPIEPTPDPGDIGGGLTPEPDPAPGLAPARIGICRVLHDHERADMNYQSRTRKPEYSHIPGGQTPETVPYHGGKGSLTLKKVWQTFLASKAVNPNPKAIKYLNHPDGGWRNKGGPWQFQQVAFGGGLVRVLRIDGERAYIDHYNNNQNPPGVKDAIDRCKVQPFSIVELDGSIVGPPNGPANILIIANKGEDLWIETKYLTFVG